MAVQKMEEISRLGTQPKGVKHLSPTSPEIQQPDSYIEPQTHDAGLKAKTINCALMTIML